VARHAISARRFGSYQLMVRGGGEG